MCGRYRAKTQAGEIQRHWTVPPNERADDAMARSEVKPTTTVAVLKGDGGDGLASDGVRWGIQPAWSKRPLLNARSDKLAGSRLWKGLVEDPAKRVLFAADGWYEWLRPEDKKAKKQPYLHLVDDGALFGMAGLLHTAELDGETVPAVTVVTTDAVGESARLHHRMPVVFADLERQRAWLTAELSPGDLDELCVGLADGVSIQPVEL